MNSQAHGRHIEPCSVIDDVPVNDLIAQYGSPLYVFSENSLRNAYRGVAGAFQSRYPDVQLAWSYKTNYLKAICALFHQEGAIAEVVSDFEYDKARNLGMAGQDIIFNGPYKPVPALKRAVEEGAKIQIDHLDELLTLAEIAEQKQKRVDVAIRVYMDSGARPVWSKFGFNADTLEAMQAVKRIQQSKYLNLVGLHCHSGTFLLDPAIYNRVAKRLIELADKARKECGSAVRYLNLGGGFPSQNRLHTQILPAETTVPSIDDYAKAICDPIHAHWPKDRKLPRLYLESGRALVDEAGYLLTTIVAHKYGSASVPSSSNGRDYDSRDKSGAPATGEHSGTANYLIDAGINLLSNSAWYQFQIRPTKPVPGPLHERSILGCLCMNIDVLRDSAALPEMNIGDHLVFHPVGAYNITQSMQFITYRPPVVMVKQDSTVEVIREKENLAHIEALERLPDDLRMPAVQPPKSASRETAK
jgi:diaminopimelate decarboxylase